MISFIALDTLMLVSNTHNTHMYVVRSQTMLQEGLVVQPESGSQSRTLSSP